LGSPPAPPSLRFKQAYKIQVLEIKKIKALSKMGRLLIMVGLEGEISA